MTHYADRVPVYRTEYIEDRDIPFLQGLISPSESNVLEVPCGAGRLAVALAPLAAHYTISDIEPGMVAATAQSLQEVHPKSLLTAIQGDMCTIDFDQTFDLIIIPREALQLLPAVKARAAIANLTQFLKGPTGRMVIDLSMFSEAGDPDYYYPEEAQGKWYKNWSRRDQSGSVLTRFSKQNEQNNRINFSFRYEQFNGANALTNFECEMIVYKHGKDLIEMAIPDGFSLLNLYGGYDKSPPKAGSSRLIAVIGVAE